MNDLIARIRAAIDGRPAGEWGIAHGKILDLHRMEVLGEVQGRTLPTPQYACVICDRDPESMFVNGDGIGLQYGPAPACDTVLTLAEAYKIGGPA